mgnify:CR=1 FL=1
MLKIYKISFIALLLVSASSQKAFPLTVARLSLQDLARQSDFVFRGILTGSTQQTQNGISYTATTYQVLRCYRMTTETCPSQPRVILADVAGGAQVDRSP